MTDFKEKYPIGSQWKCRDGSRAVVVMYGDDCFYIWYEYFGRQHCHYPDGRYKYEKATYDLIEPWKEPQVFEDEVLVIERISDKKIQCLIRSECDTGAPECNDMWDIIARKRITITEGEGLNGC